MGMIWAKNSQLRMKAILRQVESNSKTALALPSEDKVLYCYRIGTLFFLAQSFSWPPTRLETHGELVHYHSIPYKLEGPCQVAQG